MGQRVRLEPDIEAILDYARHSGYPYDHREQNPSIAEECLGFWIFDEFGTLGALWGHWISARSVTCHVCVPAGGSVDWRDLMSKMEFLADVFHADEVVIDISRHPRKNAMERLLRSIGFSHDPENQHDKPGIYRKDLNSG